MPSLIDYIRKLQDAEYERSANAMMSAIAQMSKGQGAEIQSLIVALEKKAKAITEASKLVSSEVYSEMLAQFRGDMNKVERLIRQTAPDIELSGARAANNSVTARLFYGTSQDMIEAGLDPTSAEAMAYFMQLVKDVGIPFEVPKPEDLVTKYSQSEEFFNHMDKWGDGYADYFDDAIRNGVREGWSPAKVARYARDMATNIPVNAAYTWTRTLQLQSYRDASAQMELLNGRFIEKKIRISALDGRVCPACIALHGTEVPLGQSIRDHFNGRCDAIYVPAGGEMPEFMQAMSKPGERQFTKWQNGTDWFDAQSDAYKKQVLGAGRFDLYQQGKFKLDADFVNWHEDDVFGLMPGAKPLYEIRGFGSYAESYLGINKGEIEKSVIEFNKSDYRNLWYHRPSDANKILSSGYLRASDDNWAPDIYMGRGYGEKPIIAFGVDKYTLEDFRDTMTMRVASNIEDLDLYDMRLIAFDPVSKKRFFIDQLFYDDNLTTEDKLRKAIELLLGK